MISCLLQTEEALKRLQGQTKTYLVNDIENKVVFIEQSLTSFILWKNSSWFYFYQKENKRTRSSDYNEVFSLQGYMNP